MKNRKDLTNGNISKHIISLSIPLILSNVFTTIFELVDAVFIGRLGAGYLAGVSIAGTILFFFATFGAGLSVGTVALIAKYTGSKEYEKANEVAIQSFLIGLIFSIVLGGLGYIFSKDLLIALGAKDVVLTSGVQYLRILFSFIFTMFFMFLGSAVLRGTGDTKTPMYITFFSVVLNILLDWILIFGKFGITPLGISGAAIATVISRGIGGGILIVLLIRGEHNIHIRIQKVKVSWHIIKKIINIGFPASIQMFIRSTSAIILIRIVTFFGTATIAAYGIGARIFSLFILPGFGFADASATMVGQNLGAKQFQRIHKSAYTASFYYFLVLIILSTLTFLFSAKIITIFNSEKPVVIIGAEYLKYMSVSALSLSVGLVLSRSFQGIGKAMIPMIITAISLYVFQLPLAYILSLKLHLAQRGIWMSQVISAYLQAGLIAYKWQYYKIE